MQKEIIGLVENYVSEIDFSKDSLLDEFAIATLKDRYMVPGEKLHPKKHLLGLLWLLQMMKLMHRDYMIMLVIYGLCLLRLYLSNGGTTRGLPISCFLNYVDDSREGITDHYVENAFYHLLVVVLVVLE